MGISAKNLLKVFADMNRALVSMQEERKPEVVTKNLTKATNVLYDIRAQLGEDRVVSQLPMREMAKEERVASFRRTLSENLPSDLSNLLVQMHDDALPSLKDDAVFIGKWFEGLGYKGDVRELVSQLRELQEKKENPTTFMRSILCQSGLFSKERG